MDKPDITADVVQCLVAGHAAAMSTQREDLRATFDTAAGIYHRARPDYPAALYEDLIELTGIRAPDHLVEIGCATGKATLPRTPPTATSGCSTRSPVTSP
jgi:hypothetical protein